MIFLAVVWFWFGFVLGIAGIINNDNEWSKRVKEWQDMYFETREETHKWRWKYHLLKNWGEIEDDHNHRGEDKQ